MSYGGAHGNKQKRKSKIRSRKKGEEDREIRNKK